MQSLFQTVLYALLLWCHEGISITLSPSEMISICPGGQFELTCERMIGSILYWDVSVPHLAGTTTREIIVTSRRVLLSPEFRIGFTEFNVTLISGSPLISQLLISNVTNGSRVYCSEDGNKTSASMIAIKAIHKDDTSDLSFNVSLVNQLLGINNVTVTLQWTREPGALYHINTTLETLLTKSRAIKNYDTIAVNLTISYNIQYAVSIVSSFCDVTTTKILKYITCDNLPVQLLHRSVDVITGSQDNHPLVEGQLITYTCPPGFILTGPNASVCTRNREWEPDPGQVDCIADCGVPHMDRNIKLNYSSTLEGSVLTMTCEIEMSLNSTTETTLSVTCHSNGSWIPNPAEFTCSSFITVLPGNKISWRTLLIILIPSTILAATVVVLLLCTIKRTCLAKKSTSEDLNQQPTYEEITQRHEEIPMEENAAYSHIT